MNALTRDVSADELGLPCDREMLDTGGLSDVEMGLAVKETKGGIFGFNNDCHGTFAAWSC